MSAGRGASGGATVSGTANVVIGKDAFREYTTASNSVIIGMNAGASITTGSNNILLGKDTASSSATVSNEITLGNTSINKLRVPGIGLTVTSEGLNLAGAAEFTGIVTASSYRGDGSQLTGITGTTINNNADNRVITGSGTANTLEAEDRLTFNPSNYELAVGSDGTRLEKNRIQIGVDGTNPCVKLEGYNNNSSVGRIVWQITNQYSAGSMELYHWREGMNNNGSLNIARGNNNPRGGDVLAKFYYDGDTALGIGQTSGVGIGTTNPTAKLDIKGTAKTQSLSVVGVSTLSEVLKFDANVSSTPSASGNVHIFRHDNQLQLCGGSGIRFHEGGFSRWWLTSGALYPHGTSYNNLGTSSNRVGNLFIQTSVDLVDDAELRLGDSDDLKVYHDGGNSFIDEAGTGKLLIRSNSRVDITSTSNASMIEMIVGGAVNAYHNGNLKLQTTSSGVTITGQVSASSASISGELDLTGHLDLNSDSHKIKIGAGDDLQLWHDGSNTYIRNYASSGNFYIQGDAINIGSNTSTETYLLANHNGSVDLYYDNSVRFKTLANGAWLKRESGGATDFEIYGCEGNDARIQFGADDGDDNNDYWRFVASSNSNFYLQNYGGGSWQNSILARPTGATELYQAGNLKLATTSTGIQVTGDVDSTTGVFEHTTNFSSQLKFNSSSTTNLYHGSNAQVKLALRGYGNAYQGALDAQGTDYIRLLTAADENAVMCRNNGAVELYHNGTKKIQTTSDGFYSYGTHNAYGSDGGNQNGIINVRCTGSAVYSFINFYNSAGNANTQILTHGGSTMFFNAGHYNHQINGTELIELTSTGWHPRTSSTNVDLGTSSKGWRNIYAKTAIYNGTATSDPGSNAAGQMYYKTDTKKLRVYNGTKWTDMNATTDPYWSDVVFYMNGDSASDLAGRHSVTANGNAARSTSITSPVGSSHVFSIQNGGSGNYYSIGNNLQDFAWNTGDWTLEFYRYVQSSRSSYLHTLSADGQSAKGTFKGYSNNGSSLTCYFYSNNGGGASYNSGWTFRAWDHVAFEYVSSGNTMRLYQNGTLRHTMNPNFPGGTPAHCYLGRNVNHTSEYVHHYIDNIRLSRRARYSGSNFTIPTTQYPTA